MTTDARTKAAPRIASALAKALAAAGLTVDVTKSTRLTVNELAWISVDPESCFGSTRAGITLQPKSYGAFRKRTWDWAFSDHNGVDLESKTPKVVEAVKKGLAEIAAKREATDTAHRASLAAAARVRKAFAAVGIQMTGSSVPWRGGLSAYTTESGQVMVRLDRTLEPENAARLFAHLQNAMASFKLGDAS